MKMLLHLIIANSLLCLSSNAAVTLEWDLPTNPVPSDILIFHGTDSQPPEIYDVGITNRWTLTNQLVLGAHYFAASAFYPGVGFRQLSDWSDMVAVTNVTAVDVQAVVFTSTNLADWSPILTNHILLCATNPAQFFESHTRIVLTNQVLLPPIPR